jgi:hypothetical protein
MVVHMRFRYSRFSSIASRFATALLVLASLALAAGTPAFAEKYSEPGNYLFIGGLTGFENFPDEPGTDYENTFGFDIRFGRRLMDYLAAELEGNFGTDFDVDVPTLGGTAKLALEGGNITVNVRGVYPMGRFEPYAIVGIGGMWSHLVTRKITGAICTPGFYGWWCTGTRTRLDKAGGFISKFGAGTDFWITESWAVTVDAVYVLTTGDIKEQRYTKLGWGFRLSY